MAFAILTLDNPPVNGLSYHALRVAFAGRLKGERRRIGQGNRGDEAPAKRSPAAPTSRSSVPESGPRNRICCR